RRARHARLLEDVDPLALGARGEDTLHLYDQLLAIRAALGILGEARVGRPLGMAESGHELGEEAIVAGGDDHGLVLRLETLEGHEAPGAGPLARRQVTCELEARDVPGEPSQRRLEERGVDHAAAAGAR